MSNVTLVVDDYDSAIDFFCTRLGFDLVEDRALGDTAKRWVVVAPAGSGAGGASIVLGKAADARQSAAIGNQTGGRVFLFLRTRDFDRDFGRLVQQGISIVREPSLQEYGRVAVFADPYGNLWDLIEFVPDHPLAPG